ncbi:MAG TPA: 3-isopropylmalate dehydrogenase [Candidatus Hydrogenedentes bacterium]|nr:3-isopropylmalate dehydrogenase [Candidatus Hydrogenedentota bacterium]
MPKHTIAVLEGDGIGPELIREAVKVLRAIESRSGVHFDLQYAPFGGRAYFDTGASFPEETKAVCDACDAILKGPIGLSLEDSRKIPVEEQPERGALLPLRQRYHTYANFRPVYLPPELIHFSPLRPDRIQGGIDIIMIRELVGGLYFGEKEHGETQEGLRYVKETLEYDESEIRNIVQVAFEEARKRRSILHSVHKSNVLMSSVLWNDIVFELAQHYPDVQLKHIIVDAAAAALVLNPQQFDVMVMENMFGDILSDLGGGILGSLGLMPSACVGIQKSYYEPSHGSAPDIAGKGIANPYSMIGSVALMLEKSFGMEEESRQIWNAMRQVFGAGFTTSDLRDPEGKLKIISTSDFGDRVVSALQS